MSLEKTDTMWLILGELTQMKGYKQGLYRTVLSHIHAHVITRGSSFLKTWPPFVLLNLTEGPVINFYINTALTILSGRYSNILLGNLCFRCRCLENKII